MSRPKTYNELLQILNFIFSNDWTAAQAFIHLSIYLSIYLASGSTATMAVAGFEFRSLQSKSPLPLWQ
jgi:hypothetical protein